ncbi:hypothetical protein [Kitasatospora aureofaciens]|uniref:hypothetical protein n=1 Tax=Kitasatospora aureofaciens TaxID=1894 RepID=UPI0036F47F47
MNATDPTSHATVLVTGGTSGMGFATRTGDRLAEWARLATPTAVERLHELALAGGLEPSNAFWDKQSSAYRAFAAWLHGPDLQLAVETAVFRTDDPA